jgi:hypothetical protein
LTPFSSSDPTRHCREGDWVRMRPPIPHPIAAEGWDGSLGVGPAARSALGR